MIQFTKICPHCGEEYWGTHVCEGTLREAAELAYQLQQLEELMAKDVVTHPITSHDPVAAPKHYTSHPSGVECIDITKHYNFQVGNAMKYLWRQGLKDEVGLDPVEKQVQDCEKAIWYIQSYINDLKGTK